MTYQLMLSKCDFALLVEKKIPKPKFIKKNQSPKQVNKTALFLNPDHLMNHKVERFKVFRVGPKSNQD